MTAILLPDVDLDALRKAIPSLADIDLPSMEDAGRKADETIDRLLGRTRMPFWPWLALGAMIVAVIGSVAAAFTLNRRTSRTDDDDEPGMTEVPAGITAAESSPMSSGSETMLA